VITNDFYISLDLNIIRIFVILKKIYSDNARGFLLVASHLLQYIGEDKKSSPLFLPSFLEFIGEREKRYIFSFSCPHTRSESWYSRDLSFMLALFRC